MGLTLRNTKRPSLIFKDDAGYEKVETVFTRAVATCKKDFDGLEPQLLFVIKQDTTKDQYALIKYISDVMLGIPSQCVVQEKFCNTRKPVSPQYLANVILKMNAKLGGSNVVLNESGSNKAYLPTVKSFGKDEIMFLGADVTHPASGEEGIPSVSALVGSFDKDGTAYGSTFRFQPSKVEIINGKRSRILYI